MNPMPHAQRCARIALLVLLATLATSPQSSAYMPPPEPDYDLVQDGRPETDPPSIAPPPGRTVSQSPETDPITPTDTAVRGWCETLLDVIRDLVGQRGTPGGTCDDSENHD